MADNWVPGSWVRNRVNYVYVQPSYYYSGGRYLFSRGYWVLPNNIPHGWNIRSRRDHRPRSAYHRDHRRSRGRDHRRRLSARDHRKPSIQNHRRSQGRDHRRPSVRRNKQSQGRDHRKPSVRGNKQSQVTRS